MPPSSVALRSLALALTGLCAASAMAQSQSVTAFNPYNGVGMPAGAGPTASYPQPAPPVAGMAFNPWQPAGVSAGWPASNPRGNTAGVQAPTPLGGPAAGSDFERGSYLPSPPPGPIESKLLAVPQFGGKAGMQRSTGPSAGTRMGAGAPPTPTATVTNTTPPPVQSATPEPVPIKRTTAGTASASAAPPPESKPAPTSAGQQAVQQTAPPQSAPPPAPAEKPVQQSAAPPSRPAPPAGAAMATLTFGRQSAEISGEARTELARVAANAGRLRQIELRAYAGGPDPNDARKMALARALAVRSYLIDLGVKSRIEVGAFAADGNGGATERVDVIAPGT